PRMRHICNWKGHSVVHEDEEVVFYQTLCRHVKNEGSLAILLDFVTANDLFIFEHAKIVYSKKSYRLELHREFYNDNPSRVNDMKLVGNWRRISRYPGDGITSHTRRRHNSSTDSVTYFKTVEARTVSNADLEDSFYDGVLENQLLSVSLLICLGKRDCVERIPSAYGKLRELSGEEAWETIKSISQGQKEWDNQPNIISEHEIENLKVHAKILFGNENVCVKMDRNITWDKVENSDPQSTPQVLSSFEEYTPPMTYLEEPKETLRTPIGVEPLDKTQLKDLGLNTCNHDIPLSSREVSIFDEPKPQPQPLLNCPSLDVSLGNERGPEPPIKPHISDSFRMKVVDDAKRHYGFKPGLLEQSGSLDVDFSNMKEIDDDFLGEGFSLPMKPKDLEKGNFSSKTKISFSHTVEMASRLTWDAVTTTPVTGSHQP
ncbi:hypothetical protein Tco_0693090, partial [Tanacetum coccineum]